MPNPKFKVGEIVKVTNAKGHFLHIMETLVQTCPGGTQIQYTGRLIVRDVIASRTDDAMARDYWKFLEQELEVAPAMSKEEKTLRAKIERLEKLKMKYIKAQDFEKASKVSKEVRELQSNLREG